MFENRFEEYFVRLEGNVKGTKITQMNNYGKEMMTCYNQIFTLLMEDKESENHSPNDYYQSLINAKFNIARGYSKIYESSKPEKIKNMKESLAAYKWIKDFISETVKKRGNLSETMCEQMKICFEMVELLPAKINKIANN